MMQRAAISYLIGLLLCPLAAHAAFLQISPASVTTNASDGTAAVDIRIDDPSAVAIYNLGLIYDATLLDVVVDAGADLDPGGCAFAANDMVDGMLCISIVCFPMLTTSNARIASLHLVANRVGSGSLQFNVNGCTDPEHQTACYLAGGDGENQELPCGTIGGSVSAAATVTPTLTVTQTPTATPSPTVTETVTPTATPTPSATPTLPLASDLAPALIGALPGGVACLGANLGGGVGAAANTRNLVDLGESAPFSPGECNISAGLGAGSPYDKTLTQGAPSPSVMQIDIAGNPNILPAGPLFACSILVSSDAVEGAYPIGNTASASDANGDPLPNVQGAGASIRVTSCVGDCDGDETVTIGEVQRCVAAFLGAPLCSAATLSSSCPAADANLNGAISVGEVSQCVNHFVGSCSGNQ